MWYQEWTVDQLQGTGGSKILAHRDWPEGHNPAAYDDRFRKVCCITWDEDDQVYLLHYEGSGTELLPQGFPVVERIGEFSDSGVVILGPDAKEMGYLTTWTGEETNVDPVWDAWLSITGGSADKLIANGVSLAYGSQFIRKHARKGEES